MTALEWLVKKMVQEGYFGTFCTKDMIEIERAKMQSIIDEAKAMEQQQIAEAFNKGIKSAVAEDWGETLEDNESKGAA